jgi:hypothetical protein
MESHMRTRQNSIAVVVTLAIAVLFVLFPARSFANHFQLAPFHDPANEREEIVNYYIWWLNTFGTDEEKEKFLDYFDVFAGPACNDLSCSFDTEAIHNDSWSASPDGDPNDCEYYYEFETGDWIPCP